jgi:hypothetical protein
MTGPGLNRFASYMSISIILVALPGCVVVGGYSSERGWFLWPGTIVIFLVVAIFVLLLRRRK